MISGGGGGGDREVDVTDDVHSIHYQTFPPPSLCGSFFTVDPVS